MNYECNPCMKETEFELVGFRDYYYDNEELSPDVDAVECYLCKECGSELFIAFGDEIML